MLNNPWILGGGPLTQGSSQIDGMGGSGHMVVQTQSLSIASSDGSLIHQTNTYESWVTMTGPPQVNLDLVSSSGPTPRMFNTLDMCTASSMTSRAPDTFLAVPALTESITASPSTVTVNMQTPFGAPNHVDSIMALPTSMAVTDPPLVATVQNPGEAFIAVPMPPACDPLVAVPTVPNLYNPIVSNPEPAIPIVQTSMSQTTPTVPSWYLVVQDMPDTTQSVRGNSEPSSVVRTDDDLYLCMRCDSTFEKASCINWHLRECQGDKLRTSAAPINNLSSTSIEVKTLQCSVCTRLFTVFHETSMSFLCSDCSTRTVPLTYSFGTQSIKQFRCSECGDCFQFESELEEHQSSHSSAVTICELPDNYMEENGNEDNLSVIVEPTIESPEDNDTSGSYVSESSADVEPEQSSSQNCGECGNVFSCQESLEEHMQIHGDIRSYGCTKCGIICVGRYLLNRHAWAHTREAEEKEVMADSCFEDQEEDTKDVVISQPFGCTECGMQFSDSNDLKEHCVTHLRFKPFLCTQCGEKFETTCSLERHWEAHASMMD